MENVKMILQEYRLLIQLALTGIFAVSLVGISTASKEKRMVSGIINFVVILFINVMNAINVLLYTGWQQFLDKTEVDFLKKIEVISDMPQEFYGMNAINPVSILILILILDRVCAKPFWFCFWTFAFQFLFVPSWDIRYLGWLVISFVLAFICTKVNRQKLCSSYILIHVLTYFMLRLYARADSYIFHIQHRKEEFSVCILSFATVLSVMIMMKFLKSLFDVTSVFSLIGSMIITGLQMGLVAVCSYFLILITAGIDFEEFLSDYAENREQNSYEEDVYEQSADNVVVPVIRGNSSSFLVSSAGNSYTVNLTFDGDISTCWQDGTSGDGIGETLGFTFSGSHEIRKVCIANGNLFNEDKYYANNRVQDLKLQFYQEGNLVYEQTCYLPDSYESSVNGELTYEITEMIPCDQVILQVINVYRGSQYNDLCISEVEFYE